MDTHTNTRTQPLTDANQFSYISPMLYAICYGTDNNELQIPPSDLNVVLHICLYSTMTITAGKIHVHSGFVGLEPVKLALGKRISITATCTYQKLVLQT